MRALLIILIVVTLFFGAMFPDFVVISGFLALMFMFAGMFLSLSGAFDGKRATICKIGKKLEITYRNDKHIADYPEVIGNRNLADGNGTCDYGQAAEGEIIELPQDVLSKENKAERNKEKQK